MVTSATTSEGVRDGGEAMGMLFSMGADGSGRGEDWRTQLKLVGKVQ